MLTMITEYPLFMHLFFAIFFGGFSYLVMTWGLKENGMARTFYFFMATLNIILAIAHLISFGEGLFNG